MMFLVFELSSLSSVFLPQDYENFISYICKAYKGNKVPGACAKYATGNFIRSVKLKRSPLVSRKGVNKMWDVLERIKTSLSSYIEITRLLWTHPVSFTYVTNTLKSYLDSEIWWICIIYMYQNVCLLCCEDSETFEESH